MSKKRGNGYSRGVVLYIPGLGSREFSSPSGRVPPPRPVSPSLSPPARRGGGSAARQATAGPSLSCRGFAEARLAGRRRFPGPHESGDAEAGSGASSLPRQSRHPNPAPQVADIPHSPTLHRASGCCHVKRNRGTNGLLAPNGRNCLTLMTSQSWRAARRSSAPAPQPPPALLLPAPSPQCSQSGGGKAQTRTRGRGRVVANQGGDAEWAGRGAEGRAPGSCAQLCGRLAAEAASTAGGSGSSPAVPVRILSSRPRAARSESSSTLPEL